MFELSILIEKIDGKLFFVVVGLPQWILPVSSKHMILVILASRSVRW